MVELLPSKQVTGVRFPPPASHKTFLNRKVFSFLTETKNDNYYKP